jgi:hypothetical protein
VRNTRTTGGGGSTTGILLYGLRHVYDFTVFRHNTNELVRLHSNQNKWRSTPGGYPFGKNASRSRIVGPIKTLPFYPIFLSPVANSGSPKK